jgi:L,D-peptidoglycan transpeptidase YkuD (ErfK/YbiS/YcfS/YnhG family)
MNTPLGGWIEIHGEGTGASTNWTQGCVAVENRVMNELWTQVSVGTPVLIE